MLELKKPGLFKRFSHFLGRAFYNKEDKEHQQRIDSLFKKEDPNKWKEFGEQTKDSDYIKRLKADPRTDNKLLMHAESLHSLHNGKEVAKIKGSKGTYSIRKMADGSYGCTCNDWRYKRSVASVNRDCKHIAQYKRSKR